MEMINAFIAQFYALPMVDNIVQSNAILRLAVQQFGTPLFLLVAVFILLMLVLVLSRLKPKAGRPKPIREKKAKPAKPAKTRKAKPAKTPSAKKTPAAILKKLAKIKPSPLPLYPVADKRKPLDVDMADDLTDHTQMGAMAVTPVLDDASLAESLTMTADTTADMTSEMAPEMVPEMAPEIAAETPAQPVPSFTLDEETTANLMATPAPEDDGFDMPTDHDTVMAEPEPVEVAEADLDFSDLEMPQMGTPQMARAADAAASGDPDRADFDPVPSLDFDPIEAPEPEPRPETGDDDTELDIPVASFGSGNGEGLSSSAQEKLAELNDRGVT